MDNPLKKMINKFGLPRIIIAGFFILLVIGASAFQMNMPQFFGDILRRWGMFGILALAMVPAVQCGIGLNFGISMGRRPAGRYYCHSAEYCTESVSGSHSSAVCSLGGNSGGNSDWCGSGYGNRLSLWTAVKPGKGL